jgi:hypothetical protein
MSDLDRARGEASSRGAAIGSALGSAVGSLAGGALAAAGAKVSEFVTGSVDAFARLQDSTQAASVVFGNSFGTVEKFAAGAASSIGISKSAALDASITFGTFGKAAGLAGEPLAGFSNDMVKLAGDMASFRGTSPEEAIQAIGAAFRGETDPIEKYGVLINQATVKQEAERLGLIKHGEELTNHARIMATQSLIYKQTADAQGDFQRSGDSVANTQKRIAAETENAQAQLGEKLAPAYLAVLNVLNQVITGLTAFLTAMTPVVQAVWEWRDAIAAVGAILLIMSARMIAFNVAAAAYLAVQGAIRLATTAWTTVQWLLNAALTANPIGLVVTAIAALVAIFVVAYNHSETFRNAVDGLGRAFMVLVQNAIPAITEWATKVGTSFMQAVTDVTNFVTRIGAMPGEVAAAIGGFAEMLWNNIVVAGWQRVTTFFTQDIPRWVGEVAAGLTDFGNRALAGINAGWEWVKGIWSQANQFLISTITGWIGGIVGGLTDFGNRALGGIHQGWEFTKTTWQQANQFLLDRTSAFVTDTGNRLASFGQMLKDKVVAAWEALPPGIRGPIEAVVNAAIQMGKDIVNALVNLPSEMVTMGQQIIDGLLNGLKSKGQQIVDYLTNLIPGPVRQALGISSPSSVMHDIGNMTIQGLINGLQQLMPQVQSTLNQIISIINSVKSSLGISSPSSLMHEIGEFLMQGLDNGLQSWIPKIQATLDKVVNMAKSNMQQIGQVAEDGSKVAAGFYDEIMLHGQKFVKGDPGYAAAAKRIGLSDAQINTAKAGVSQISDDLRNENWNTAYDRATGLVKQLGPSTHIDARSFGTQLNPKDVVDQILWKAKAGGLVPA